MKIFILKWLLNNLEKEGLIKIHLITIKNKEGIYLRWRKDAF